MPGYTSEAKNGVLIFITVWLDDRPDPHDCLLILILDPASAILVMQAVSIVYVAITRRKVYSEACVDAPSWSEVVNKVRPGLNQYILNIDYTSSRAIRI